MKVIIGPGESGQATLSTYSKRKIGQIQYDKGRAFVASALLLKRHCGNEAVVLYLLCQGIEVALKALLLLKDFDLYEKKRFGHDIVKVANEAASSFGLHPLSSPLAEQLRRVSLLYSDRRQLLRYGSLSDILIPASSIERERVMRRMFAAIRLADRHIQRIKP
ncbi:hypothetical protein [Pandoraea pnomenusa]|uniref:hypothetical protein n=1 Tax=Pandoraea pnomenusa TaxID=93220 RepID=UPI0033407E25